MRRRITSNHATLALAMSIGIAPALAGHRAVDPPIKPMPEEAWGSVLVDQGSAWATHEPTRRIAELALRSGVIGDAEAAWKELAGVLNMEEAEAFNALLGERVALVWGKRDEFEVTPWGVVTNVADDKVALLERRLDAAPRGFDQGRPVILVERGRFRLSKLDQRDGVDELEAWTRLLLSPANADQSRGWIARSLTATESMKRAPGAIVGYWRADAAGAYVVASVSKQDRGWDASVRCTPEALGLTRPFCDRLAKEPAASDPAFGQEVLLEAWCRVPTQAPGLVKPPAEIATLLTAARITAPSTQWSGDRVVLRVVREQGEGFSVLMACEVKDRRAASAWFDGMISGVLDFAGRVQGAGGQIAAELRQDLVKAGNDPSAMRLVVLGGRAQREKGRDPKPQVDPGTLAWTTVGEGAGGWWVLQYRSGATERDAAERFLRDAAAEVVRAPWGSRVALVRARPAALWKLVGGEALEGQGGWIDLLAELDTVESSLAATSKGVEGIARARMTEAAAKPSKAAQPEPAGR